MPFLITRLGYELDYNYPWTVLATAMARRELLRAAELPEQAARWDDIYRRYDRAIADRDKLAAVMFWQL